MVVLYRPAPGAAANISSYLDQVERLYVVDNTEVPDTSLACLPNAHEKIEYLPQRRNTGVAAALNVGARLAISAGYEWLLTMDQDSLATANMVMTMLDCRAGSRTGDVGLISPLHEQVGGAQRQSLGRCVTVLTAMTSGSLVYLPAYRAVGPFLEQLFMDQVDNEFCLRLQVAGYSVVEAGEARLIHRVGEVRFHRFPTPMYSTNHPPVRRYYMTRNRLYVGRKYRDRFPEYRRSEIRQIAKDAAKILLHEQQKRAKLAMMIRGYRDYRKDRLGAFEAVR